MTLSFPALLQPDKYIVHAEVPGVSKEDIKVSVEDGQRGCTPRSVGKHSRASRTHMRLPAH